LHKSVASPYHSNQSTPKKSIHKKPIDTQEQCFIQMTDHPFSINANQKRGEGDKRTGRRGGIKKNSRPPSILSYRGHFICVTQVTTLFYLYSRSISFSFFYFSTVCCFAWKKKIQNLIKWQASKMLASQTGRFLLLA
jgi:hypothetical protein